MQVACDDLMEQVVHGFEIGGVLILVVGALAPFGAAAASCRRVGWLAAYEGAPWAARWRSG